MPGDALHTPRAVLRLCLLLALLAFPAGRVAAFPPLPSSFYGPVKFNHASPPDGTSVEALINGQVFAFATTQTYQGNAVYSLDVPGDDSTTAAIEGGREGDQVSFRIGGQLAEQTATWHSGTNVEMALSAAYQPTSPPVEPTQPSQLTSTAFVVLTRTPTGTPTGTPTSTSTGTATAAATPTATQNLSSPAPTLGRSLPASTTVVPLSPTAAAVIRAQETSEPGKVEQVSRWWLVPVILVGLALLVIIIWLLVKRHRSNQLDEY